MFRVEPEGEMGYPHKTHWKIVRSEKLTSGNRLYNIGQVPPAGAEYRIWRLPFGFGLLRIRNF